MKDVEFLPLQENLKPRSTGIYQEIIIPNKNVFDMGSDNNIS